MKLFISGFSYRVSCDSTHPQVWGCDFRSKLFNECLYFIMLNINNKGLVLCISFILIL